MKKSPLLFTIFKLLIAFIITSHSSNLFACDPIWYQFKIAVCDLEEEDIFTGEIIGQGDQYIDLKIIDSPRSCETQPIVRMWDGPTVWCNGAFEAPVAQFGSVGDSVICIAQKIDTILTDWDIIGDYRRPITFSYENFKKVKNNQVLDFPANGGNTYDTIPYQNFINQLDSDCMEVDCTTSISENCADNPLDCNDLELSIFPNPTYQKLRFSTNYTWDKFRITDITGRMILEEIEGENVPEINVSNLAQGVYIFSLIEDGNLVESAKFVKQ